ncbi:MAG: hypothetical protein HY680_01975 [Chloroflexi bacterium]|nr:hypothetical protein [Chloroflexota bacterium]
MTTPGDASDAVVRMFLERLFVRTPHRPSGAEPQVLIGRLPPGWDIPLPDDAKVVGSYVPMDFQVRLVLDMPGQFDQAGEKLVQALTGGGWRLQTGMGMRSGGFMPSSSSPAFGRMLVDERRRRTLTLTAMPGDGGLTDVRLDLNSDPQAFASRERAERMGAGHDIMSVIPPLTPPPGMRQSGGGELMTWAV